MCHVYRWGPEPEKALDATWSAAERMQGIDALDDRTLSVCGLVRVWRGEQERGIADLHRAIEVNPNSVNTLMMLSGMSGVEPSRDRRLCQPIVKPGNGLARRSTKFTATIRLAA